MTAQIITMFLSIIVGLEANIAIIETAQATTTPVLIESGEKVGPVELTVEEKIIKQAVENGFDPELLVKIAWCESEFKNVPNYLYDGENGIYTAYGPFQILKSTASNYSTKDRRIIDNNIEIAMMLFEDRGSQPWNESRSCWQK